MPSADQPTGIREINELRILNALRQQPGLSRSAIARRTGLGKATISLIVADFLKKDLVHEIGPDLRNVSVGRHPVKLTLNGAAHFAIGVELTGNECFGVLTDLHGAALRSLRYPQPLTSVGSSLERVARIVAELLQGYDGTKLLGVGIGVPGTVDAAQQCVILAENLGWVDVPFGSLLTQRIGQPVILVNRTNAGAVGEWWHGSGKGADNLIYASLSVGVGAGIIINGTLYEGTNGSAGELGHITVEPNGHLCACGNTGCLETLVSTRAVAARAKEILTGGSASLLIDWTGGNLELITGILVIEAAAAGDTIAITIVQDAAGYLGLALANVVNLFNPAIIIVDGDMLELGDLFMEPIRRMVQLRAFSISRSAVRIVPSGLRHQAAAIGAACMVIDRVFVGTKQMDTSAAAAG